MTLTATSPLKQTEPAQEAQEETPSAVRRPNRRAVMVSAVLTQLMIVLDLTIIAIALPHMQEDLGMTVSQSPWTVTGYSLAFGGLVLFGGRLCAVVGIRRSYQVGLIGFGIASLAAGLAPSFPVLVTARVAQGCFGALLAPTSQSLLNVTFTERAERERVFAIFGATGGLGAAVGLLVGGALTDWFSWRWALYINIFLAAAALLIGQRSLPPADQRDRGSRITDDLSGLVLGCGACFSAVYGLDRAQQTSWTSTSTVSWLALGGIAAVLLWGGAVSGGEDLTAGLGALQTMTIIAAAPFSVVMVLACLATLRAFSNEHRQRLRLENRVLRREMTEHVMGKVTEHVKESVAEHLDGQEITVSEESASGDKTREPFRIKLSRRRNRASE